MTTGGWNVAGRQFRSRSDYEAACRDNKKIEAIKESYNLDDAQEILRLQADVEAKQFRFETMVGDDFLYEIEEMAKKAKMEPGTNTKKKKSSAKAKKKTKSKTTSNSKTFDEYDDDMKVEILWQLKQREKRRRWVIVCCTLAAVFCFGYFGVYYYFADRTSSTYEEWAQLKEDSANHSSANVGTNTATDDAVLENRPILDEYKTLYNKNKSLIGWVKIDDTNIDYPVMQTVNNTYYLDHNLEQEYDKNGSIFLDKDCDVLKPSMNLIIYGHHMKSGKMFGSLDKYSNEAFYQEHKFIYFDTIYEKGKYEIMYVFRSKVYNEDEIVFKYYQFIDANSAEEFYSNMEEMSKLSLYDTGVTAQYGDRLLTLSTCDHSEQDGRFVVVAKKVN